MKRPSVMLPAAGNIRQRCSMQFLHWHQRVSLSLRQLPEGSLPQNMSRHVPSGASPELHHQPQEFLQAQTFTDVLASVASDWHQPNAQQNAWGGSFMTAGDWNFEPTVSAAPEPRAAPGDCSSNNSGDVAPMKQEDMSSPVDERQGSDADSDGEAHTLPRPGSSSRVKETASGRAEQRRTRKREKDRIEEFQTAIQKGEEANEQLQARTLDLAQQLQEKDEELQKLRAAEESSLPAADDDRLAASFEGSLQLTVQDGQKILLSPEQLRSLSEDELRGLWGKYVHRLRDLLQAGKQPGSQQQQISQRIQVLQREAIILHIRSAIVNASNVKKLCTSDNADRLGEQQLKFWTRVASGLQLSPSQKGLMTELWQSFHSRIGLLMEVRRSIHQHLVSTIPDGVFGRSFAINFLKTHELMDALKYNLRQEHIVLCDLIANFHKVLTPLQNARCIVDSWPQLPDMPQIALTVARSLRGC